MDSALRGVAFVDAHHPIAKPANQYSMIPDIADAGFLAVRVRVKAVSRMRRDQLQGETSGLIRVAAALPTREIPVEGGTFRIFGPRICAGTGRRIRIFRTASAIPCRIHPNTGRQRNGFRHVLGLAFGKPSHVDGRSRGLGSGMNDLIALLQKVLPAHELREVGRIENALAPIELGAASLREQGTQSQARQNIQEYLVIRLRLAQGLDAFVLHDHRTVIDLILPVVEKSSAVGPLRNVPALERGARRQNDVRELRFVLHPNRLVDDELERRMAIRLDESAPNRESCRATRNRSGTAYARASARAPDIRTARIDLRARTVPGVAAAMPVDDGFRQPAGAGWSA